VNPIEVLAAVPLSQKVGRGTPGQAILYMGQRDRTRSGTNPGSAGSPVCSDGTALRDTSGTVDFGAMSQACRLCARSGGVSAMPRICNREGCGRRIVAEDGSPDYRKHFCGAACLKIDKRERVQAKRLRLENQRCSHCGRKPIHAVTVAVSSGGLSVRDASSDARVKLHHALGDAIEVPAGAEAEEGQSNAPRDPK